MEGIPWFAWIVIAGILAYAVITTVGLFANGGRRSEMKAALEQNAETNRAVQARLEGIDSRLAAVEKTLSDIP